MVLKITNPCRNIVDHLNFERKILLNKIETRKAFLFHQDIATPFFVERLDYSFHPQTKTTIIIDKIIQIL